MNPIAALDHQPPALLSVQLLTVGVFFTAYLAAVTGLFADILFNEARVCAHLLNLFAVPPC